MNKEELIKIWLTGELTNSERDEFEKFDDYNLNNEILNDAKYFKASHFSKVKDYADLKSKLKIKNTPVIQFSSYKMLFRIAALFIISSGIYFAFFFNTLTTVKTFASQKTTFELPDASLVVLNVDSKAEFNKNKWTKKREITLEGEAFFKVAKGSKFEVITSDGKIGVLGTQFNVKRRNNYFEVKCFEGVVLVSYHGMEYELTKGETFRALNNTISENNTILLKPQWIKGMSNFKSVPLYEVLNELERQYNVKVITKNIDSLSLFTGAFVHNNLEDALMVITEPFNLTYTKNSANKITIFGE